MTSPNPTFDNNAFAMLESLLQQWGLSSLSGNVRDMLTAGDSADVIPIKLRQTDVYKERFKGNLDRVQNGLPAMTEAEYLATEAQLKTVVRRYVGSGEYDSQKNIEKWIAGDLSPQELNDRMSMYQQSYLNQTQDVKDAWAAEGLTPADAIKALMDPSVDETRLKRNAAIYSLGAASVNAFGDSRALEQDRLGELVDQGVKLDDAAQGYRDIAARGEREGFLARTAGMGLSMEDQENAALLGDATAEAKRKKVLDTEEGRYKENYLGTQSSLSRNAQGAY